MKTPITDPVTGHVYMAQRIYNAKRMVMEPFRYDGLNPDPTARYYKYLGTWMLDGRRGCVTALCLLDLKWVKRKLIQLSEEQDFNNRCADNLVNLLS